MKLDCFPLTDYPVEIAPGRLNRDWMDEFSHGQPYRCLPLNIANCSGWELRVATTFRAAWNGGRAAADITIQSPRESPDAHKDYVSSHFGGGIITFQSHYLFQTDQNWDLFVSGAPNWMKHGIMPLTGVVETSWLPQPFTMNWRFTQPGAVVFEKGEPFGWIMPIPHTAVDEVQPLLRDLREEPELLARHRAWNEGRYAFLTDPDREPGAWQRHYFKGEHVGGDKGPDDHLSRRRLKAPVKSEKSK